MGDRDRGRNDQSTELASLADERHRDPGRVYERAREILDGLTIDHADRPLAAWVVGLAAHELNRPDEAVSHLREATRAAEKAEDRHRAAVARASLAISLLATGDTTGAEHEIAAAAQRAPEAARGLVGLLDGLVQQRTGRLDDALGTYEVALMRLRRTGDDANAARLLLNRGTLFAYQGAWSDALADLTECESIAARLDLWVLMAMAAHNLGFAEGRQGRFPQALSAFDRSEAAYASQGNPRRLLAALWSDRGEVYLEAGLTADAVDAATRALEILGVDGDATHRSEALLLQAQARLAHGDLEGAREAGQEAARSLRAGRRQAWAALADYLVLQAEVRATQDLERVPPVRMLRRAQRIAGLLDGSGWPVEALHVRTLIARIAIARGESDRARTELESVLGPSRPVRGSARLRAETWHATALLRLAEGDRIGAKRALRRGLATIDEHRASLGATELRTGAGTRSLELARLGLRLASNDGRPWDVLNWAELGRAGALRHPAVTPPDDPGIRDALQSLRDLHAARRAGTLPTNLASSFEAEIERLEHVVRSRTLAGGGSRAGQQASLDVGDLKAASRGTAIVELVPIDGRLAAVVVVDGRARLVDLGAQAAIAAEIRYLVVGLSRVMATPVDDPAWATRTAAVSASAETVDRLLIQPLGPLPDDIVVVPTGPLHSLPWLSLPSLRSRRVTVAPSLARWQHGRARSGRRRRPRTTIVAGPGLTHGMAEVDRLQQHHPSAQVLTRSAATTSGVLDAMANADLVHLAAHGHFRADSPLFSSLRLEDGPLTVYDLERLESVPETVVLPVCNAGVMAVRAGDELLGTASAMVGLGVRSIVAPVLPVPDAATADVMDLLHGTLSSHAEAADSLSGCVTADDPVTAVVASAFLCIGTR